MDEVRKEFAKLRNVAITVLILIVLVGVWALIRETDARIGAQGILEIQNIPSGSEVILNGRTEERTTEGLSTIQLNLSSDTHSIIIDRPGHWPWRKTLFIPEDETITVAPFLIPTHFEATQLTSGSPEYIDAQEAFATLHTQNVPSPDGTILASISGLSVEIEWLGASTTLPLAFCTPECESKQIVFTAREPIQTIGFLQDRNDVLLMSTISGIYALETDTRDVHNLQPLVRGQYNDFRIYATSSLYITDGESYLSIAL